VTDTQVFATGTSSDRVIGHDRDPEEIADRLLQGRSIVVVGSLGSGRSHLARAVAATLRDRGLDPFLLGRDDPLPSWTAGGGPALLVADDADTLEPDALELLTRAVRGGRVRVLLTASDEPSPRSPGLPQALSHLWLDGVAERLDLEELDAATADELITSFVGSGGVDTVARAVITQRAAGSRMLLREFALVAAEAQRTGHDPLWESRAARAGSRLAEVLRAVVDRYDDDQRLGLALVGRLDGVEHATLTRIVPASVIDGLVARRVLRDTGGAERRLYATAPLALEAEHALPAGRVDAAVDDLVTRMLTAPGVTPSVPLMRAAAAAWHSGRDTVPSPADVPVELRGTVLRTAAAEANSEGRSDLALSYVALGFALDGHPGLHLEASRAFARLRRPDAAYAEISRLDPTGVPVPELRRLVRWWATVVGWQPSGHSFADRIDDPGVRLELEAQRAEAAYLDMDWSEGERRARAVLAFPHGGTLVRLRASAVAAMSAAQLGRGDEALELLARADRMNRDPVTGRPVSVRSELALICFQAFASMVSRRPLPPLADRLAYALAASAARKDRSGLALAGIASGVALGVAAGDDDHGQRELGAALGRIDRIEYAVFRPLVAQLRAGALAGVGRVDEARTVLAEIDIEELRMHRLFRYSRHIAEHAIAVAAGELGTAEAALCAAEAERAQGDPSARSSALGEQRRARLAELLAAADAPAVPASPATAGGYDPERLLTEREREIALLVAHRLSNKEIAQKLFLSVRTVESHIYAARGKLGAGSRRELGERVRHDDGDARPSDGRL
jgi:DNA-binding CsgD family transcriptional regulator